MMSFAILAIVKATLVCGVAFLLSRLCRRTRASVRHLLFALAFTALIAIPGVGTVLPTVAVTVPATATPPAVRAQDMASAALSSARADRSGSSTPSVSRDTAPSRSVTIAQVVTTIWLIGVALFLIPVVVGFWQLRRLRQVALPWTDRQALVETLARTLGVHRRIDALLHEAVTGPMACGVLKPAIILPVSAQQWDEATLRCALRHELEHVARWDFLTHCLSRMVCAAYWFHPLVWAAWRRSRLEAERACDDAVLREEDARDYASLLVAIAQREPADTRQPLLAMAGRGDLAARVAAVLDHYQSRGRVGRRWAAGLIVTGALAMVGVAPITVERAVAQTQATGSTTPLAKFETASIKRSQGSDMPSRVELFRVYAGGRMATNATVRQLLQFAHRVRDIDNAPGWVDSNRFDIVAKAPSGTTPQQARDMLLSLLDERFKLVAHRGSKEFPIYALVLARPDGSLGPRMTPSQVDCRSKPGQSSACGLSGIAGRVAGRGVTMAQLATLLPRHLGGGSHIIFDRPMIDRTGLTGAFDFTLESTAPNFPAALQEQLGLKLDSQLAPEPVLVIDKIEPPTEN